MQINIMNSRVIALVAQDKDRWPLAGDQLYLDLDLSADNLPTGTRLTLGSATLKSPRRLTPAAISLSVVLEWTQ